MSSKHVRSHHLATVACQVICPRNKAITSPSRFGFQVFLFCVLLVSTQTAVTDSETHFPNALTILHNCKPFPASNAGIVTNNDYYSSIAALIAKADKEQYARQSKQQSKGLYE